MRKGTKLPHEISILSNEELKIREEASQKAEAPDAPEATETTEESK